MNKPTILLTGGTGFLGSKLLEALMGQDYSVVLLKRSTSKLWRIDHLIKNIKSYDVDKVPLNKAFEEQKIDIVIHTACEYGHGDKLIQQIVESNILFGIKVLDACLKYNTKTFFNTDTLLPSNLNAYTLSKKHFVEWLKIKSNKVQVVNLKIELMYGIKDDSTKFIPWVISQLKQNAPEIKLTTGEQKRDFIYVEDVVSAFMTILKKTSDLQRYNEFDVGTGKLIEVKVFLEYLKKIYQSNFGAIKTKLAFGEIPYRQQEIMTVEVDNKPLIHLGWSPKMDVQQGLKEILKEYT